MLEFGRYYDKNISWDSLAISVFFVLESLKSYTLHPFPVLEHMREHRPSNQSNVTSMFSWFSFTDQHCRGEEEITSLPTCHALCATLVVSQPCQFPTLHVSNGKVSFCVLSAYSSGTVTKNLIWEKQDRNGEARMSQDNHGK